ncbi:hypothetical protein [Ornithinimicrobium kibberense]|uniref:hypothetical protein n=1 Tax=Ornithinimicrobium kibberense TaxID=282060 RepID=UPI003606B981
MAGRPSVVDLGWEPWLRSRVSARWSTTPTVACPPPRAPCPRRCCGCGPAAGCDASPGSPRSRPTGGSSAR